MRACRICDNKHYSLGLCRIHYRQEYNSRPEVREHKNAYKREYTKRPYVKVKLRAWAKKYYQRPEVKAKRIIYVKKWQQDPKNRVKLNQYERTYLNKHPIERSLKAKKSAVFCPNCSTYTMTKFRNTHIIKCTFCGYVMHNQLPVRVTKKEIRRCREKYFKNKPNEGVKQ